MTWNTSHEALIKCRESRTLFYEGIIIFKLQKYFLFIKVLFKWLNNSLLKEMWIYMEIFKYSDLGKLETTHTQKIWTQKTNFIQKVSTSSGSITIFTQIFLKVYVLSACGYRQNGHWIRKIYCKLNCPLSVFEPNLWNIVNKFKYYLDWMCTHRIH